MHQDERMSRGRDDDMEDGGEANSGRFTDDLPRQVVAFVDGKWMTSLMATLTIFVLWGDDFRVSAVTKEHDAYFYFLFTFALFMFLMEFALNTIAKENYKWSFFFWLDLIAAVSIMPDIAWILVFIDQIASTSDSASMASGVQSARTARIVRLVRLIRLIRIVKLYSVYTKTANADGEEKLRAQALAAQNAKQAALKRVEASRLGKVLSEMTTRRVVIMVLLMLTCLPMLLYKDKDTSKQFGLSQIFWYGRSDCSGGGDGFLCETQGKDTQWISERGWRNLIFLFSQVDKDHQLTSVYGIPADDNLLWLYIPNRLHGGKLESIQVVDSDFGTWEYDKSCGGFVVSDDCQFRHSDLELVGYQPFECSQENEDVGCTAVWVYARFEKEKRMIVEAHFRMITTIFVCVLLGSMSIQFQSDTQALVIAPIEKMVNIIKQLAEDPLRKPDLANFEETELPKKSGKNKKGPQLETTMLENTILKIGGLLQVSFGEAGAQIIGNNMSSGDGELNIMMPGTRVTSIFGFVDIRCFTDTTECLQEEVMVFVNTIGCILHQCVHRWGGVSNKNIGDAFLLLWKLPEPDATGKAQGVDVAIRTADLANRALLSFLKFTMECRRSERIKGYSTHPLIIGRFGDSYNVTFGLGLHSGWAIEGPIGSDFKVDASYLSPHVNLTMTLEAATKIYKVPLLMSEKFYNMLSARTKERVRKVDVIMFGHSAQGLYAVPMNDVIVEAPVGHVVGEIVKLDGLDVEVSLMEEDGAEYLFIVDQDVTNIQKDLPEIVYAHFREALVHYVLGEWKDAKILLDRSLEIDPTDGPSCAMMTFIAAHDFVAPADWEGWRSLDC
eukprot:GEMP01010391.1.p1 GENE.GEMP01010391.1~~GEMP01010391.1.p1  ORF type:complete len:838 (-),score=180.00 GEMP01010391.1:687-3200(-)